MKVKHLFNIVLVFFLVASYSTSWGAEPVGFTADEEEHFSRLIETGKNLLQLGKLEQSIRYFERVSIAYEDKYTDYEGKVYSASSAADTRYYLELATKNNQQATVVSTNWALSYFLSGHALVELGRYNEAQIYIERAVELMPANNTFIEELGQLYQKKQEWGKQFKLYQSLENIAANFVESDRKIILLKAWKGKAYALTQQDKLDEAIAYYKKCLELDKNDARSIQELEHLTKLKKANSETLASKQPEAAPVPDKSVASADTSAMSQMAEAPMITASPEEMERVAESTEKAAREADVLQINVREANIDNILKRASVAILKGRPQQTLTLSDQVIEAYEAQYKGAGKKIYCARNDTERAFYLSENKDAIVLSSIWGDAYSLKALALASLGNVSEARKSLARSLELAPASADYLLQLANIEKIEKNWSDLIEVAKRAEQKNQYTDQEEKNIMMARAQRMIAFAYKQQGNIEQARKYYRKVLEYYPSHTEALRELKLIEQNRDQ